MIADYFDALTAYRCWDAWPNGLLCAQAVYDAWAPRTAQQARCACITEAAHAAAHTKGGQWQSAPVFGCHCGIYAHKTEARAQQRFREGRDRQWHSQHDSRVWGVVRLWGRVIEHEDGYRAEYAYPGALWANDQAIAAKVAALYGVACRYEPKAEPVQEDDPFTISFKGLTWAGTAPQSYYIASNPVRVSHASQVFWRNATAIQQSPWFTYPTGGSTPSPMLPAIGAIRIPSPSIVKALGGTPYQQRAAMQKVQHEQDWRAVLTRGLHGLRNNADADAMTITGATT